MKIHCFVSLTPTRRKHSHIWTESQCTMSRTLRPWRPDTRPLFGLHHLWKGPKKLQMSPRILITGYSLSDQHIFSLHNQPKIWRLILSDLQRFTQIALKFETCKPCRNIPNTPITAIKCRQCLPLSVVQLKGKHCQKSHCGIGVVVDTYGPCVLKFRTICLNLLKSDKLSRLIWVNNWWQNMLIWQRTTCTELVMPF